MQAFDFDYCDTYESYGSSGVVLENNRVRLFKCYECKVDKPVVKKSVSDSRFRCDNCIQNQNPFHQPTADETTPQYSWRWLNFFT